MISQITDFFNGRQPTYAKLNDKYKREFGQVAANRAVPEDETLITNSNPDGVNRTEIICVFVDAFRFHFETDFHQSLGEITVGIC